MGTKHLWSLMVLVFASALHAEPAFVEWQDGQTSYKAYLVQGLIAHFHPERGERKRFGSRLGAKSEIDQPTATVYRVARAKYLQAFKVGSDRFQSPVFSDGPQGGQLRSLPGGVLITLPKGVDAEKWAEANQKKLVRPIGSGTTWLVETPPGLKSLETAQELGKDPAVVSSTPNWWVHLEARKAQPTSEELARLRRSWNNSSP